MLEYDRIDIAEKHQELMFIKQTNQKSVIFAIVGTI